MAGGWARDGAVQDQIDASVKDAIKRVRSQLPRVKAGTTARSAIARFRWRAGRRCPGCGCAWLARRRSTASKR